MRLFLQVSCGLVLVCAATMAQADGIRDAASKIRGDYDSVSRPRTFSYSAPRMANPAPMATAQAPVERRSFSAEPSQPAAAPSTTQQPARAARVYSYQPSYGQGRHHLYDSNADTIRDAGSKIRADF